MLGKYKAVLALLLLIILVPLTLLEYDNAEVYFYQDDRDIITNLDNYMDMIHFTKEINYDIYDKLSRKEARLTKDNYEQRLDNMYNLSQEIVDDLIKEYYN